MKITIEELRTLAKEDKAFGMKNFIRQWEDGTFWSIWRYNQDLPEKLSTGERVLNITTGDGGALDIYDKFTSKEYWIKSLNKLNVNEIIKNATSN